MVRLRLVKMYPASGFALLLAVVAAALAVGNLEVEDLTSELGATLNSLDSETVELAAAPTGTCPAGSKKTEGMDSYTCTGCVAGEFAEAGATTCSQCKAGEYSSAQAATCSKCAAGKFSPSESATSIDTCASCVAGKFSAVNASVCTECTPGHFSAAANSTACDPCAAAHYSVAASTTCHACGSNTSETVFTGPPDADRPAGVDMYERPSPDSPGTAGTVPCTKECGECMRNTTQKLCVHVAKWNTRGGSAHCTSDCKPQYAAPAADNELCTAV